MKPILSFCAGIMMLACISLAGPVLAHKHVETALSGPAYSNATILIIRHAEKSDDGDELSAAGVARSNAYVHYFQTYKIDGRPVHLDAIYAAADSAGSARTRLTVEPLSHALGLPIDTSFKNKDFDDLADLLKSKASGKTVLISWHHHKIPDLVNALGADPSKLIPGGVWPDDQYGWVIQLCYDKSGHLIPSKTARIVEPM